MNYFQFQKQANGQTVVLSDDKRAMARWYALDYLVDKPREAKAGIYMAAVSTDFYFRPAFRRRDKTK